MSCFPLGRNGCLSVLFCFMMIVQGAPLITSAPGPERAASSRAADDWPQFHNNAAREGATAFSAPAANTTIWSFQTGGPVNASPVVSNGVVHVPSSDGSLYALNYSTGDLIWKVQSGGPYYTPAVAAGFVFAGSEDGNLRAFHSGNGTPYFSYQSGHPVRTPVLVFGTAVIFGNEAGNLTALDLSGSPMWTNTTGLPLQRAPATDGTFVFACARNILGAYSIVNGQRAWAQTAGTGNLSHPAFHNGRVFAGSDDGFMRAYDALSGAPRWSTQLGSAAAGAPAFSGGSLYIGTAGGRFHTLNTGNGSETNVTVGASMSSSPALSAGGILLGASSGVLALAQNGTELWRLDLPGGVDSSPAVTNGRAFVGTAGGSVLAFGFRHTSTINSFGPSMATQGTFVSFNGSSPDCVPMAYRWRSSRDGLLSTKPSFTISTLTLGLHALEFCIQDSNFTWSAPDTATVEITPSDDWPMFGKDTSHRGFSQGEAPQTGTVVWKTAVGGKVYSSPVVYRGMVFVTSREVDAPRVYGALNALDAETGAVRWTYRDTTALMDSTPACADGMVFVGDDGGNLIAFDADPSDGIDEGIQDKGGTERDIIWSYENTSVQGSPAVAAGKVIVPFKGSAKVEASVQALDEFTGKPVWKFALPDPNNSTIWSSPVVDSGLVLFGSNNKHLYALHLETGQEAWNFSAKGAIQSSPCVYGDTVYFGSSDWKLYALAVSNGTKKWERTTSADVTSTPAYANGKVFFGSWDNTFYALDAETGETIWTFQANGPIHSSAAVGGGLVMFAAFDGMVYAINETTHREVWKAQPEPGVQQFLRSSPALVDGRVYIGTEGGYVVAFGKAPDLDVPSSEINFSSANPMVGQEVTVTARIYNRGTLNATADARMSDGLPGIEIASARISVPVGRYVDFFGNWTVQPGVHTIVVNVTNAAPYEVTVFNNKGSRLYTPPSQPGWTMFKADGPRTSNRANLTIPNTNSLNWSSETRPGTYSSPVTAGNRLYQASGDTIFAFDSRDGAILWSYNAGSAVFSTPAVSNILVFGTSDGRIIALNEWDGSFIWTLQTGGEVRSSPLIVSETVYVGSSDGYLYALRLSSYLTGTVLWKTYLGGPVLSSPAYDQQSDRIVVGSHFGAGAGRIWALRPADGVETWTLNVPAPVVSTPALSGGLAVVGCDDGFLYALEIMPDGIDEGLPDPENSTTDVIWTANLMSLVAGDDIRIRSSPAVDAGLVFVGAGSNTLLAVNMTTGLLAWHRLLGDPVAGKYMMSSPAVADNRVFIGARALYALNARTGGTVWSYAPEDWFWSSPAISADSRAPFRGVVYAVSEGGLVCAFASSVKIPPQAVITSPAQGQTFRVGELISFDGRGSLDPDGDIVNYTWSLGEGNQSFEPAFTFSFGLAGVYNISLNVRDEKGLEGKANVEITIRNNSAPRLNFPLVNDTIGDVFTIFRLRVTYYDMDNDLARNITAAAAGRAVPLEEADPDDTNTIDGKDFFCATVLPSGVYGIYFEASDGVLTNRSDETPAITVTNRSMFQYQGILDVELFYAGRGGVTFNNPISLHAPYPGKIVSNEILISESNLDKWWWAKITYNYSGAVLSQVNASTLRLYWWNGTSWTLAENAGIDLAQNITYANVTQLGNFTVIGQPPVNRAPVARLGKDITIWEGETATLDGSTSYDTDDTNLSYSWDFGDGSPVLSTNGTKVDHKYPKAGRFTATLIVSDGKTNSTPAMLTVTVKQRGGEQYVLILVVIVVLVVGILFFMPRGDRKPEDRWKEDDERFRKGMEDHKLPGKKGRRPGGEEE